MSTAAMPTPPAEVPPPLSPGMPLGFARIQGYELSRFFGLVVDIRLAGLPVFLALAGWIVAVEPAPWRRNLILVASCLVTVFFVLEAVRYRRRGMGKWSIPVNLGAAMIGQSALAFASGGLDSPFLYVMFPLAFVAGIFLPMPLLLPSLGFQVSALALFAWLGIAGPIADFNLLAFGGGFRAAGTDARVLAHAVALALVVVIGARAGRTVRAVFDSMIRRALSAREESLLAHAERAQELTALSGEIAHELKNPLASVKGLAGLLAHEARDSKAAERIAVLRREVDRMQSILEEFLNFSRPLVPLALEDVPLHNLCEEVALLHEGLARERGLVLEIRGAAGVRCDPRKVKQVVINLVQNAIGAADRGSVEIELEASARGGACIRVLDHGAGIAPAIEGKVFEPGFTTKSSGSGLGLTIARSLARQHGGGLSLANRAGGGCVAELWLPAEPPADGAQGGAT